MATASVIMKFILFGSKAYKNFASKENKKLLQKL